MTPDQLLGQVREAAVDLGRLKKHLPADLEYARFLCERIAKNLEVLDAAHRMTAADMVREGVPVAEALLEVDRERREFRSLAGVLTPEEALA